MNDPGAGPQVSPEISIIIVSWNVWEHLQRCLQMLPQAVTPFSYEVIVIDNASEDGTTARLARAFPQARVWRNDRNLLYTAAANQGLRLARGRYLLLLNPDVMPHPHSIARLIQYAETHPQAGLLGPRIVDAEGQDDWRTGRNFPTPWSEFVDWSGLGRLSGLPAFLVKNRRLFYDRGTTAAVPVLSGACLLFSPHLPADLKQLQPDFPMYGEDIDLCRRVAQTDFHNILVAEATMTHLGGASSSQMPERAPLLAIAAMNHYFEQWHGPMTARWHRALIAGIAVIKSLFFCSLGKFIQDKQANCLIYWRLLQWAIMGVKPLL